MITMLIDHIGFMLLLNGKLYGYDMSLYSYVSILDSAKWIMIAYRICRMIGRISFPLYAFCIVEGFMRTRNLFKYLLRLLLLAVISEIPYNLMTANSILSISNQNVIWTFILGLFMLFGFKKIKNSFVVQVIILVVIAYIAYFLKTDYDYKGIILMALYYWTRYDRNMRTLTNSIFTAFMSSEADYGFGIFSSFFIHFYDGTRGELNLNKLFYAFYPVHMLILYFIVFFSYQLR